MAPWQLLSNDDAMPVLVILELWMGCISLASKSSGLHLMPIRASRLSPPLNAAHPLMRVASWSLVTVLKWAEARDQGLDNELVIILEWAEAGDLGLALKSRAQSGAQFPQEQVHKLFSQVRTWGAAQPQLQLSLKAWGWH
eukprot:1159292-Pelagomonas_calceolata.AAC.1